MMTVSSESRSLSAVPTSPNRRPLARRGVRVRSLQGGLLMLAVCHALGAAAPQTIDLPTTLRLAGANNLDVQIAREKVNEARAAHDSARARFFPFISPGIVVRRHDDNSPHCH